LTTEQIQAAVKLLRKVLEENQSLLIPDNPTLSEFQQGDQDKSKVRFIKMKGGVK